MASSAYPPRAAVGSGSSVGDPSASPTGARSSARDPQQQRIIPGRPPASAALASTPPGGVLDVTDPTSALVISGAMIRGAPLPQCGDAAGKTPASEPPLTAATGESVATSSSSLGGAAASASMQPHSSGDGGGGGEGPSAAGPATEMAHAGPSREGATTRPAAAAAAEQQHHQHPSVVNSGPRPAVTSVHFERVDLLGRRRRIYTMKEVAQHNTPEDCWLVAHGKVYDVTAFLSHHPAGEQAILRHGGTDATTDFDFHSGRAQRMWTPFFLGYTDQRSECVLS